ncbi:MAG: hypothetical protein ACLSTO_08115 [Bilophila wadsworthia]
MNKICGSSLKAVAEAAWPSAREARCVVAGGMENMSLASMSCPLRTLGAAWACQARGRDDQGRPLGRFQRLSWASPPRTWRPHHLP